MPEKEKIAEELLKQLKKEDNDKEIVLDSETRKIWHKEHKKYIVTVPGIFLRKIDFNEGDSIKFDLIQKGDTSDLKMSYIRKK